MTRTGIVSATALVMVGLAWTSSALLSATNGFNALIGAQQFYNIPGTFNHDHTNKVLDPNYVPLLQAAIAVGGGSNGLQARKHEFLMQSIKSSKNKLRLMDSHDDDDAVVPLLGTRFSWKNMLPAGSYPTTFNVWVVSPFFFASPSGSLTWSNVPGVSWAATGDGESQIVTATDGVVEDGAGTSCQRVADAQTGAVWNYANTEVGWNKAIFKGQYFGEEDDKIVIFSGEVDDIGSGQDPVGVTIAMRCYGNQTDMFGAGLQCKPKFIDFAQTVCSGPFALSANGVSIFTSGGRPQAYTPLAVPANCAGVAVGSYNAVRDQRCHSCTRAYTNPLNCN